MKNCFLFLLIIFIASFSNFSFADPINLANYARIMATDTRNTFFGLWPRETDDAFYTVRDGNFDTGWKIPSVGKHSLILDFAPLIRRPPSLASIAAVWERMPTGLVSVRIFEHCGGEELHRGDWVDLLNPYTIEPPLEAFCLEMDIKDAGFANLLELDVFADENGIHPSIEGVVAAPLSSGIKITWESKDEKTCFVEIHYVADTSQPLSKDNLIDITPVNGSWEGPSPVFEGFFAAIVPLACDGTRGEVHFVELPFEEKQILKNSGVIEGFYGRPWLHIERRKMIMRLAQLGLGLYIYAPKNDPLHRDFWRIFYSQSSVERFLELQKLGDMLGVKFSFGISPGLDMVLDDPAERAVLLTKLAPFAEGGFRSFTLLFDDIEWNISDEVDSVLAAKHVDLTNWLKAELTKVAGDEIEMFFVPTVYSTQRQNSFPYGSGYLDVLANLDQDIKVMWTGTDTFSQMLEAQDLLDVTSRINRKPVIWDNEHATDGGDLFYGKVYLAPYINRSADLVKAVEGIVANPMILGAPNRIVVGTYADYLKNPEIYEPNGALAESVHLEGVDELDDFLALRLAETFYGNAALGMSALNFPFNPAMELAIDKFKTVFPSGFLRDVVGAGFNLLNVAAEMATMQSAMYHSALDVFLVDDLWFPSDRLTHEGFALIWLLDWAGSLLEGKQNKYFLEKAENYLWLSLFDRYQLSFLKVISFWLYLKNQAPKPVGFVKPTIYEPDMKPVVGEVWSYTPCLDSKVIVGTYGLPGAYVVNNTIFWSPSHPGVYRAVVVAASDSGWAWREIFLVAGLAKEVKDDDLKSEGCGCSLL